MKDPIQRGLASAARQVRLDVVDGAPHVSVRRLQCPLPARSQALQLLVETDVQGVAKARPLLTSLNSFKEDAHPVVSATMPTVVLSYTSFDQATESVKDKDVVGSLYATAMGHL